MQAELEFMLSFLKIKKKLTDWATQVLLYGDCFLELVYSTNTSDGVVVVQQVPSVSMYRIETINHDLIEFQQSADGPDYQAITNNAHSSKAIRFGKEDIVHMRWLHTNKNYPYGESFLHRPPGIKDHTLRILLEGYLEEIAARHLELRDPSKIYNFTIRLNDK
jgi:hypothetical protein